MASETVPPHPDRIYDAIRPLPTGEVTECGVNTIHITRSALTQSCAHAQCLDQRLERTGIFRACPCVIGTAGAGDRGLRHGAEQQPR